MPRVSLGASGQVRFAGRRVSLFDVEVPEAFWEAPQLGLELAGRYGAGFDLAAVTHELTHDGP